MTIDVQGGDTIDFYWSSEDNSARDLRNIDGISVAWLADDFY